MLNTVAGLLRPAEGEVSLDGRPVTGRSPDRMLRAGLALVPERRRLFAEMTVVEHLRIGGVTAAADERAVSAAVDGFGVWGALPAGERAAALRRVVDLIEARAEARWLARGATHALDFHGDPKALILADNPTV